MGFQTDTQNGPQSATPVRVRVPVGLQDGQQIGAGDLLKRFTSALGVKPCQPCEARAEALNRFLTFYR